MERDPLPFFLIQVGIVALLQQPVRRQQIHLLHRAVDGVVLPVRRGEPLVVRSRSGSGTPALAAQPAIAGIVPDRDRRTQCVGAQLHEGAHRSLGFRSERSQTVRSALAIPAQSTGTICRYGLAFHIWSIECSTGSCARLLLHCWAADCSISPPTSSGVICHHILPGPAPCFLFKPAFIHAAQRPSITSGPGIPAPIHGISGERSCDWRLGAASRLTTAFLPLLLGLRGRPRRSMRARSG